MSNRLLCGYASGEQACGALLHLLALHLRGGGLLRAQGGLREERAPERPGEGG